jgi:hypothetical protein
MPIGEDGAVTLFVWAPVTSEFYFMGPGPRFMLGDMGDTPPMSVDEGGELLAAALCEHMGLWLQGKQQQQQGEKRGQQQGGHKRARSSSDAVGTDADSADEDEDEVGAAKHV